MLYFRPLLQERQRLQEFLRSQPQPWGNNAHNRSFGINHDLKILVGLGRDVFDMHNAADFHIGDVDDKMVGHVGRFAFQRQVVTQNLEFAALVDTD